MADRQERLARIAALEDILRGMSRPPVLPTLGALICEQGFFEPDFYLGKYPDVKAACVDPAMHYLIYGWREARSAGSWCDQDELARLFTEQPEIAKREFAEYLAEFLQWINKSICGI